MQAEHGELTEVTDEVTYTRSGEPLPDGVGAALGISMKYPDEAEGYTLYFPVVQECEDGATTSWIQKPQKGESEEDLEDPAPSIMLTAANEEGHHGAAMDDDATGDDDSDAAKDSNDANYVTSHYLAERLDSVRFMAYIALFLGAMSLILSLLSLRTRIKSNNKK
jgi:hypothetical protein